MKTVSDGTKKIVARRVRGEDMEEMFRKYPAMAVINGNVADLIYASDLAQKASGVEVFEVLGNCPQHMTCLALLGNAAAIDEAVARIQAEFG